MESERSLSSRPSGSFIESDRSLIPVGGSTRSLLSVRMDSVLSFSGRGILMSAGFCSSSERTNSSSFLSSSKSFWDSSCSPSEDAVGPPGMVTPLASAAYTSLLLLNLRNTARSASSSGLWSI
eukprot:Lithocolla_globosa_v1_NODE_4316_length_1465_cov_3.770922.p2 type:complete len:123 gc:universal NODE_4316_length_1465_cov_3.770922:474-842(+)